MTYGTSGRSQLATELQNYRFLITVKVGIIQVLSVL